MFAGLTLAGKGWLNTAGNKTRDLVPGDSICIDLMREVVLTWFERLTG